MKAISIIALLLITISLQAQNVSFKIVAPKAVEMGETFQISYQVNANGKNFTGPTFTDFDYLAGPYTSTQSSYQNINGKTSQTITQSFTYQVRAKKPGKFTIPSAKIIVDGKNISSNTASIEVVSGNKNNNSNPTSQTPTQSSNSEEAAEGVLFGRTAASKKTVFVGEPIIITQKIYSEQKIANLSEFKEPNYDGFWKETINIGDLSLERESYGNKVYNSVTLQKMILFPQRAGNLDIGSFEAKTTLAIIKTRKPRDQWEQWMYGNTIQYAENANLMVNSPKITIKVKPLPEIGKPNNFSGIIGNFNLKAEIDKNKTEVNEAITLKIKISGEGNIELIQLPDIKFPSDFEVYDPKINTISDKSIAGVKGSKSYEYLIIPRNEGLFLLEPIEFSYFDITKEKYITLKSDTIKIQIGKNSSKTYITSETVNRTKVNQISEDIRFIKTKSTDWFSRDYLYFNSKIHLLLLLGMPLILILIIVLRRNQIEKNKDLANLRNKKATKVAKKRLAKAEKLLKAKESKEFYEEISRAIWGYLSDKFNIPLSTLSMENVREKLSPLMQNDGINEIISVLNDCEYARFAPVSSTNQPDQIYHNTLLIISKIEKSLK